MPSLAESGMPAILGPFPIKGQQPRLTTRYKQLQIQIYQNKHFCKRDNTTQNRHYYKLSAPTVFLFSAITNTSYFLHDNHFYLDHRNMGISYLLQVCALSNSPDVQLSPQVFKRPSGVSYTALCV